LVITLFQESSAVILANSAAVRHTVDVSTYAGHTDDTGLYGGKKRKRKRFSCVIIVFKFA